MIFPNYIIRYKNKKLWLKACEMKLKVYRLIFRIIEVSNQCVFIDCRCRQNLHSIPNIWYILCLFIVVFNPRP